MKKIIKMVFSSFVILSFFFAVAAPSLAQEIRGQAASEQTIAGINHYLNISDGIVSWHPQNFAGFYYELDDEPGSEELRILDSASLIGTRTIFPDKLVYSTSGDNRMLNVVKYPFHGNCSAAELAGLKGFRAGNMSSECGKYLAVGWQGEKYIGIKNKANKLSHSIVEHREEKKTLMIGETWNIGAGIELTINSIDARSNPRQVWISLKKNGIVLDETIISDHKIYTYVEKNLVGESNVPLLVTYVDAIFTGSTYDFVQFRYTWLIDSNAFEIKSGDKFGVFTATNVNSSIIELRNEQHTILLSRGTNLNLMGTMGFKVADSNILRFYPKAGI